MHRRRDVRGHIQLPCQDTPDSAHRDRKSTRLNSSHDQISYAVFCLKKKKKKNDYREHTQNESNTTYGSSLGSSASLRSTMQRVTVQCIPSKRELVAMRRDTSTASAT